MRFLRKNTAVNVTVGPVLACADGLTPKDTMTVNGLTGVITYDADDDDAVAHFHLAPETTGDNAMVAVAGCGMWDLALTAAQLNFTGRAILCLTDPAQICPVFHEFQVLSANVYDSLFAGHGITPTLLNVPTGGITCK